MPGLRLALAAFAAALVPLGGLASDDQASPDRAAAATSATPRPGVPTRMMSTVADVVAILPIPCRLGTESPAKRNTVVAMESVEDGCLTDPPGESPANPDDDDALVALTEWLKSPDAKVREKAIKALGAMGPAAKGAAKQLGEVVADRDQAVATLAAATLPKLGDSGLSALAAQVESKDEAVRLRASTALVAAGKSAVPYLIDRLGHERKEVVGLASASLSNLGADAVPALKEALKDDRFQVRGFAAITLGAIGPKARSAAPAVRSLLDDRHAGVRAAAAEALPKIER